MMGDIGRAIAEGIITMIVFAFIAGVLLTAALIFGIPWLWHMLKPWLHTVTS